MKDKKSVLRNIIGKGMLPLYYCHSQTVSLDVARVLYKAGVRAIEYTNRGSAALENFTEMKKILAKDAPDLYLGIGTIKTAQEAEHYVSAGADFLVAPIVNPAVAAVAQEAGLLWIPGCMTPTEIYQAQQYDAPLIKLFPAGILGPDFMLSIRVLFPKQSFIPTGGVEIDEDNIRRWIRSGVSAVGLGSKLITEQLLIDANYDLLYDNTLLALNIVQKIRNEINPFNRNEFI